LGRFGTSSSDIPEPTTTLGKSLSLGSVLEIDFPNAGTPVAWCQATLDGLNPIRPNQETIMNNASKRAAGAVEELGGKIKGAVGKLVGNDRMQAGGKATELKGRARQSVAKATERTKGKVEEIVGSIETRLGAAAGNERVRVQGKATELKGDARQRGNR
jgi:uncharacterized protein YjbJ (UPF0337 family)